MSFDSTRLRRKLVVFDFNGCLGRTDYDGAAFGSVGDGDFSVHRKVVYVRPYVHTMLAYVTASYDIAVWTCNSRYYADPLTKRLFGRYASLLRFVWTADECDRIAAPAASTDHHEELMRKNLDRISAAFPEYVRSADAHCASGQRRDRRYTHDDIVLIDDSLVKGTTSRLDRVASVIVIPTFTPARETTADTVLLSLKTRIDQHFECHS